MTPVQRILQSRRRHVPQPQPQHVLSRRERAELRQPVPMHIRIR